MVTERSLRTNFTELILKMYLHRCFLQQHQKSSLQKQRKKNELNCLFHDKADAKDNATTVS